MIPFSRISIQTTSTNQICETPYLNECKGDPNNTITTSYHIFNTWIPFGYLWSYPRNLHIASLDPLPWRSRLGAPDFSPQISCEFFRWPACKGTRSEGKTAWDKTILNYWYTSITKTFAREMSKDGKMPTLQSILKRFWERNSAPRAVLPPSDSAQLQLQLAGAAGGDARVPGLQVAVACLQRHIQQSNSTFIYVPRVDRIFPQWLGDFHDIALSMQGEWICCYACVDWYGMVWYCNTMQCNALQCNAM